MPILYVPGNTFSVMVMSGPKWIHKLFFVCVLCFKSVTWWTSNTARVQLQNRVTVCNMKELKNLYLSNQLNTTAQRDQLRSVTLIVCKV